MDSTELANLIRPQVFRAFGRTNKIDAEPNHIRFNYDVDRDEVQVDTEQLIRLAKLLDKHTLQMTIDSDRADRVSVSIWV